MSHLPFIVEGVPLYQLVVDVGRGETQLGVIPNPEGVEPSKLVSASTPLRPLFPDTDELIKLARPHPESGWTLQGLDVASISGRALGDQAEEDLSGQYTDAVRSVAPSLDIVARFPMLVIERVSLREVSSQWIVHVSRHGTIDLGTSPPSDRGRLLDAVLTFIGEAVGFEASSAL